MRRKQFAKNHFPRRTLYAIIASLLHVLNETVSQYNQHLAIVEAEASAKLQARLGELADADRVTLEAVWTERQELAAKLDKARMRRKEARRLTE